MDEKDQTNSQELLPSPLTQLVGSWKGQTRTWFMPGELADESTWEGTFRLVLSGRFLMHEYSGSLQGNPLEGIALIGFNEQRQRFEMAWVDSFHNGQAIMFSVGGAKGDPFTVLGSFPDFSGGPDWGWRTQIDLLDADHLTIRHYTITPQGEEGLGVETVYTRQ